VCPSSTKTILIISEALGILWSKWGQRFQLVAFLLLGLIFATLHHLLGRYLSGEPVPQVVSFGRWEVHSQSLVNALSNVISQMVKWLLASTIGVAFVQYFWSATKNHEWRKLDAPLAAANGNPFTISALPTWYRSPGLAFSALMMMSMIFIPIFVPGSIRVVTSGLPRPCNVDSPNINVTDLASTTGGGSTGLTAYKATTYTTALVNRVIVGGSYLPPFPSSCGICTYEVNFIAPSLKCSSDINATYDFSTNLPLSYNNDPSLLPILNGTMESGYALTVATQDGTNPPVAVRCDAFSADYHVQMRHDNFFSHIDVLKVTHGAGLSPALGIQPDPLQLALDGLVQAVGAAFNGSVILDIFYDGFSGTPLNVAYSSMMHWVHTTGKPSVTWSDLTTSLPELMQNVSLSLLSGQFPSRDQTYMTKVPTKCLITQLVYDYNSSRLLAIYAAAWGAAAIFFSLGFLFIWKNEGEHNLDFSHVVGQLHLGLVASEELNVGTRGVTPPRFRRASFRD